MLAAGASGAWMGTAFAGCSESLASESARQVLLQSVETDTVTTSVFDVALGYPWPSRFPERVLRNEFWDRGRDARIHLPQVRRLVPNCWQHGRKATTASPTWTLVRESECSPRSAPLLRCWSDCVLALLTCCDRGRSSAQNHRRESRRVDPGSRKSGVTAQQVTARRHKSRRLCELDD